MTDASVKPIDKRSHLKGHGLQIMLAGLAYTTALLLELQGRDKLSEWSYWAAVLLSVALPLWILSWMIHTQRELLPEPKSRFWWKVSRGTMSAAVLLSMVATGLEMIRLLGVGSAGFIVVASVVTVAGERFTRGLEIVETDNGSRQTSSEDQSPG